MNGFEFSYDENKLDDIADIFENRNEQNVLSQVTAGRQNDGGIMRSIGEVCNKHDIPPGERVDFACEGFRWYSRRIEEQCVISFRQGLEDIEAMFK
jgi:hypothetical protein